jgi:hypothetical protein
MCNMDANAGIGRAGATRYKANARLAGHRPIGTGHERCATFLAASDNIHSAAIVQCIQHWEKALARHRKDAVGTLFDQAIDQQCGCGLRCFVGHGRHLAVGDVCGNPGGGGNFTIKAAAKAAILVKRYD